MIVMGVDPGTATGVAIFDIEKDFNALNLVNGFQAMLYEPEEYEDALPWLAEQADLIVIERYDIGPATIRKTRQLEALYLIGATRYECRRHKTEFDIQARADAKNAFNDDLLRRYDVWTGVTHSRDATRHALLALRRQGFRL